MSIKTKLILALSLTLGLGGLAIVAEIRASFADDAAVVAGQSVREAAASFQTLADGERSKLTSTLTAVLGDTELVNAWADGSRERLLAKTQPSYAAFKKQGITNWSFTGTDGTTFLRLSDPSYFGERVDRPTVVRCLEQKAGQSGFAVGSQGFALRVSLPVFKAEVFLGCAEMGSEINRFVATMKEQTGHDYALFLSKKGIDPEKWARGRKLLGLPDNFGDRPNGVIAANTHGDDTILLLDQPIDSLDSKGRVLSIFTEADKSLTRGAFSIMDANGAAAAAIFVETDISDFAASMHRSQVTAISVVVVLIALCSVILIAMFRRLVFTRLDNITRVATRVVGGDFECVIPVSANDEIGRFEELFEQFRQVFLSVLQEANARAPAPPPEDQKQAG